ncbi:response regulator transcription factor [Roseburia sp. MSJ-14]|uniref:response regulator transcription factor n=1 Tax=Roseburia sp. MSJ-14 TaxID=2841514 RepID=UPI001C11332F|nr:response regulator transcription factor [Roseburia sp. MSJ-14]MBU5474683.1 response regulator transcription factor [Roseburia sp. MSJ-14]
MYKLLIVEDDAVIAKSIQTYMESWGYQPICITDFEHVTKTFVEEQPHLVLMDISLPFYNGFHWCDEIRKISKVPVIFISSASDNMNIVMAMNMGGDDFIAKPFDLPVLQAKVQAMLRRTYDFAGESNLIEHKGMIFNSSDGMITYEGKRIELTKNEMRILQELLENKGKIVTRDRLMERLWESDSFIDDNTLTVNIARLRKKLEETGIKDMIKTRKGIGYVVD